MILAKHAIAPLLNTAITKSAAMNPHCPHSFLCSNITILTFSEHFKLPVTFI